MWEFRPREVLGELAEKAERWLHIGHLICLRELSVEGARWLVIDVLWLARPPLRVGEDFVELDGRLRLWYRDGWQPDVRGWRRVPGGRMTWRGRRYAIDMRDVVLLGEGFRTRAVLVKL